MGKPWAQMEPEEKIEHLHQEVLRATRLTFASNSAQ